MRIGDIENAPKKGAAPATTTPTTGTPSQVPVWITPIYYYGEGGGGGAKKIKKPTPPPTPQKKATKSTTGGGQTGTTTTTPRWIYGISPLEKFKKSKEKTPEEELDEAYREYIEAFNKGRGGVVNIPQTLWPDVETWPGEQTPATNREITPIETLRNAIEKYGTTTNASAAETNQKKETLSSIAPPIQNNVILRAIQDTLNNYYDTMPTYSLISKGASSIYEDAGARLIQNVLNNFIPRDKSYQSRPPTPPTLYYNKGKTGRTSYTPSTPRNLFAADAARYNAMAANYLGQGNTLTGVPQEQPEEGKTVTYYGYPFPYYMFFGGGGGYYGNYADNLRRYYNALMNWRI